MNVGASTACEGKGGRGGGSETENEAARIRTERGMSGGRAREQASETSLYEVLAEAQRVEPEVDFEELVHNRERRHALLLVVGALLGCSEALHELNAGIVQPLRLLPGFGELFLSLLRHLRGSRRTGWSKGCVSESKRGRDRGETLRAG